MNARRPDPSMVKAMARLRRALEKRLRMDERSEELARREKRPSAGRLADYDMRALGRRLRPMLDFDGRGWRDIAAEMGVTAADLSRVMAGQDIAGRKLFAICDWAGLNDRAFFIPAAHAPKPRKRPRPTARRRRVFHVASTETGTAP